LHQALNRSRHPHSPAVKTLFQFFSAAAAGYAGARVTATQSVTLFLREFECWKLKFARKKHGHAKYG
jgi:hypothetical protein